MEKINFPIVIKKRNSLTISASITEIAVGIILGFTGGGGLRSPILWIFVFTGIITALSLLGDYSQDIILKENKIEFYNKTDLKKSIKYSNITSICVEKGKEPKYKKKDFFTLEFGNSKSSKAENYQINPMNYSVGDLTKIKDIIVNKNSAITVSKDMDKFLGK